MEIRMSDFRGSLLYCPATVYKIKIPLCAFELLTSTYNNENKIQGEHLGKSFRKIN